MTTNKRTPAGNKRKLIDYKIEREQTVTLVASNRQHVVDVLGDEANNYQDAVSKAICDRILAQIER